MIVIKRLMTDCDWALECHLLLFVFCFPFVGSVADFSVGIEDSASTDTGLYTPLAQFSLNSVTDVVRRSTGASTWFSGCSKVRRWRNHFNLIPIKLITSDNIPADSRMIDKALLSPSSSTTMGFNYLRAKSINCTSFWLTIKIFKLHHLWRRQKSNWAGGIFRLRIKVDFLFLLE